LISGIRPTLSSVCPTKAANFKYIPGKWYHILAELKGDEFVMQFADGYSNEKEAS
jgi:hypothetical protein